VSVKTFVSQFLIVFFIAFIIMILVTYFWSLVFHGSGIVDWRISFIFAFLFGVLLASLKSRKG